MTAPTKDSTTTALAKVALPPAIQARREEMRERMFSDWDMERVSPDDIRDVLEDALGSAEDPKNAQVLALLLEHLDSGQLRELSTA